MVSIPDGFSPPCAQPLMTWLQVASFRRQLSRALRHRTCPPTEEECLGTAESKTHPTLQHFNTRRCMGIGPDDAAGQRVFSGISLIPPPLHSGAAAFIPGFALVGSQDLVVKKLPNLSTPLSHRKGVNSVIEVAFAIGSQFIRPALDASEPITDLQENTLRIAELPGAAVVERLARSPPTKTNRVQSPAGSPDFRKWESGRTMPMVGGFPRGSPVSPAPSFRRRSIFASITLIGSRDLAVKSRPNLFTIGRSSFRVASQKRQFNIEYKTGGEDDHEESIDGHEHENSGNAEDVDGDFLDALTHSSHTFHQRVSFDKQHEEIRRRQERSLRISRRPH
ncbi:hypothetical protein PR048_010589 [Dryococelus australis]|uniref:Uncharacterized protein n=1 Tax=Dryococelus australis TaxID=614101 RepID=A0ABQ9I357_9NEOP|nr:hypothetical protein PR048_010589 [Dryococelus australis]